MLPAYVDASRIFNIGGPAVREATKRALKGTPEDLKAFLSSSATATKAPQQPWIRVVTHTPFSPTSRDSQHNCVDADRTGVGPFEEPRQR
ncbi:ALF repeat-containing protein [Streptomyces sp. NBC_00829]|uniref:ALF repeat-containing protein n=1 Tax=Streptomyces sp. NBC_00829 TaxID=2903679 RepID=UPI003867227B|nr:ALF repeat-containing protein [Streptomyces sp. NBC_00829]